MSESRFEHRSRLALLALLLWALLLYLPSIEGPFVYDDEALIAGRKDFLALSNWQAFFTTDFFAQTIFQGPRVFYYRPLVSLSYALDAAAGGFSPWLFHLSNLSLFAAVAWLSQRWMRRVLGSGWPLLLGFALFLLHPGKAESVAWISGRTDLLCSLFLLSATESYARYLSKPSPLRLIGCSLFCTAALLSKETGLLVPVFLAFEYLRSQDFSLAALTPAKGDAQSLSARLSQGAKQLLLAPLRPVVLSAGLALGYLLLRLRFLPFHEGLRKLELGSRLLTPSEALGNSWWALVYPSDLSLHPNQYRPASAAAGDWTELVLARQTYNWLLLLLALASLLTALCSWRRFSLRSRWLLLLCCACLLPTLGVVPTGLLDRFAPRFLFLASLPFFACIASWLGCWMKGPEPGGAQPGYGRAPIRRSARIAVVSLLAIWLSWWSSETFLRAQDFISDERLWAYEFSLHPDVPDVIQRRNQSDAPRFGKKIARARMECGMDQALLYQDYLSGARLLLRSLTWALAAPPQEGEAEAAWEKVQAERFSSFQKGLAALTIDAPLFQARVDALSGSPETMQASIEVALASCDGCEQARARAIEVCLSAGQFQLARTYANTQQLQLRIDQQEGLANAALAQPPLVAALIQARRFTELGEPARAAAEVLPFFEEIRQIPDPELRQAASMILQNGGEVQLALELNPSQTGMAPLAPKRDEEFLPDSCALPSERAAPLLPRLLR